MDLELSINKFKEAQRVTEKLEKSVFNFLKTISEHPYFETEDSEIKFGNYDTQYDGVYPEFVLGNLRGSNSSNSMNYYYCKAIYSLNFGRCNLNGLGFNLNNVEQRRSFIRLCRSIPELLEKLDKKVTSEIEIIEKAKAALKDII